MKPPGAQAKSKKPQGATRHGDKNGTTTEEADRTEDRNTAERGERPRERERRRRRWPEEAVEEGDREEEPWRKTSRQPEGESRSDEMEEPPTDVQPKDERTWQKTGEN